MPCAGDLNRILFSIHKFRVTKNRPPLWILKTIEMKTFSRHGLIYVFCIIPIEWNQNNEEPFVGPGSHREVAVAKYLNRSRTEPTEFA